MSDCPAIVRVPVRVGPLVGATFTLTVPGPDPAAVPTVIQFALLDAVHGQPAPAVTDTSCDPPAAPAAYVAGEMEYVQPSDCVTLKCNPAIVNVPARGGPVVAATVKETVADPFPFAPELIEIQFTSDTAVHVQSALDACTSTLPVPPVCGIDVALLERSIRHSPAACAICARWPFTMTPPVRAAGSAFGATLN